MPESSKITTSSGPSAGAPPNPACAQMDVSSMARAYMVCALWSSVTHDHRPMDDVADIDDIDGATANTMCEECQDFVNANFNDIEEFMGKGYNLEAVGHDLWLTRNGHGAGFWDRGAGAVGNRLTVAAKAEGSRDLCLGDDGKVYSS